MLFRYRALVMALAAFVCLTFFARRTAAQTPVPHTLLWRISGKGLTRPSYLFGTMHLSDKRLFRFDDSVYRAIERSDGLAIELNPDELVAYYINKAFDKLETDHAKRLDEILSKKDYEKYSAPLSKRLHKPADEITGKDILKEKNRWVDDYLTKGEMPTFVDAYLYNIARRQGKWLGGIEDLADQTGIINEETVDKSDIDLLTNPVVRGRSFIEEMIGLYEAQNLEGIEAATAETGNNMSTLLYRRNVKMARRMDSLSALRSMFFAVGAAHLPGDSGVIQMLRRRGFNLTPVMCAHKTEADKYTFKEVPTPWYNVSDVGGNYTVQMPGNPASVKIYGLVDAQFLFDLFNMVGYCTIAVLSMDGMHADGAYERLAGNLFGTGKHPHYKTIMHEGIAGREYTADMQGNPARVQLFYHQRVMHMVMMYGFKKSGLTSADAARFFESYKIIGHAAPVAGILNMRPFTDTTMAVTIGAVTKLSPMKLPLTEDVTKSWDVRTYAGLDATNELYQMLTIQGVKEDYHIRNDSSALMEKYEQLATRYHPVTAQPYHIEGAMAMLVSGKANGIPMKALMVVRGNREYLMLLLADSSHLARVNTDSVFSTLRLLPYRKSQTSPQRDSAETFTTYSPSPLHRISEPSFPPQLRYTAYDSNSSTTYTVSIDTLSASQWYTSDSAAWTKQLADYYEPGKDVIVSMRKTVNGTDEGREWILRKQGAGIYNRIRILKHGRVMYQIFTSGDEALLRSDVSDGFYTGFRALQPAPRFDWLRSRRDELLAGIRSKAEDKRDEAISGLRAATFTRKDLPALQAAFVRSYHALYGDDTDDAVNAIIGQHLATIADTGTLRFLRTLYPKLAGRDTIKRHAIILTLARMQTVASYNMMADLLTTYPTGGVSSYDLRFALNDSLKLLHSIYPRLLPLVRDRELSQHLAALLLRLRDSGLLHIEDIRSAEPDFIAASKRIVRSMQEDTTVFAHPTELIQLLGAYNSDASTEALKDYYVLPRNAYLRMYALMELLRHNRPADSTVILGLAADSSMRLQLYRGLEEKGRAGLYPKKYKTQRYFARALAYEAASGNDDEEVAKVSYLGMRTASVDGEAQRYYLYKVTYATDDTASKPWLAVAGGFPLDEGKALPKKGRDVSGVYYQEAYEQGREEALFDAFMAQVSERRESAEPDN